jgi:ABC-type phosphate transport system permease subunit
MPVTAIAALCILCAFAVGVAAGVFLTIFTAERNYPRRR